jgi:hypothetical protein
MTNDNSEEMIPDWNGLGIDSLKRKGNLSRSIGTKRPRTGMPWILGGF